MIIFLRCRAAITQSQRSTPAIAKVKLYKVLNSSITRHHNLYLEIINKLVKIISSVKFHKFKDPRLGITGVKEKVEDL